MCDQCPYGGSWGKDCPINYDGSHGFSGQNGKIVSESGTVIEIIDKRVVLDFPYILQDMLLKYAIGLQVKD